MYNNKFYHFIKLHGKEIAKNQKLVPKNLMFGQF